MLMLPPLPPSQVKQFTYLSFGILSIDDNPANLDNFGAVLGDIDAMLVTRGSNVDNAVLLERRLRGLLLLIWNRRRLGRSAFGLIWGLLLLRGSSTSAAAV